jgi:galactokinase
MELGISYIVAPRTDREVRLYSENFREFDQFSLEEEIERSELNWSNYVRGVAKFLSEKVALNGMDALIYGDLPIGAGLSSSAAMEVGAALSFQAVSSFSMDRKSLALICQRAENEFVGMRCGIMDQFASLLCEEGMALFIDCRSLETKNIPLPKGYLIAVCDSKVRRELVSSEYNKRRWECEQAARLLGVRSLRDATPIMIRDMWEEEILLGNFYKRAKHVVEENERVLSAVDALKKKDVKRFGKLMVGSHLSLRNLYEVSCRELDLLVEIALRAEGVLGARLTGAGFGGCTVNLLEEHAKDRFEETVKKKYKEATGLEADIWFTHPAQGGVIESLS